MADREDEPAADRPAADRTASGPAAGSLRAALRHRGFGRFLTATVISSIGDFLNSVGLLVVVYRVTGSVGWLGAAAFFRIVAWSGATAAGGVVGDRFDRRKVLVSLNVAAGMVALVLALAAEVGAGVLVLILLATLLDLSTGLVNPSFSASVPALVGEEDVAAANAAVTTVEQVSQVAGPALGAVLVTLFSPELAFLLNGLTFLLAAALLAGVPAGGNMEDREGPPARFRDGLSAVRRSRAASVLLTVFVAAVFAFGFSVVLMMLVAVQRLGMDEAGVGYLHMAEGVGGVTIAVVAGRFAVRGAAGVLVTVGLLIGLVPMLLALTTSLTVALVVLAIGGAAYVVFEVIIVTWLQRVTPDEMLGRVMGLLMSLGGIGTAAGALLAPIMEQTIGLQWSLVFSGAVVVVVVVAVAPALPEIARQAHVRGTELEPFVDVLRDLDLFVAADEQALERLASSIVDESLDAGVVVIREGAVAEDLYVVRAGSLAVTAAGESGGVPRLVNTMGPDDWFGEIGLLERTERTATVTTTEATTLWRIPGAVFLAAFETSTMRSDVVRSGIAVRLARTHPSRAAEAPG